MKKIILLTALISMFWVGAGWAILTGDQVLNNVYDATTKVLKTNTTATVASITNPIWNAPPPIKVYEFTVSLSSLGTSSTLFTIGTPISGYMAFIDDIIIIRDEAQPIDYMNLQLIDMGNNKTIGGGEIVPASPIRMTPATPLLATECKLLLQNKSASVQRIKISIVVSVRKTNDPIYGQPY